ncbi:hypothetical protein P5673_012800 [Acropora cervicornis]|uniref:Uncharacterized protein n=1 Tax=Acropora cervicornis TaxID=6130 RepID=A0AAD9QMQ6_ACRCE|nr:hypothetical protein P5673_012800 [Acropora cervicornis]
MAVGSQTFCEICIANDIYRTTGKEKWLNSYQSLSFLSFQRFSVFFSHLLNFFFYKEHGTTLFSDSSFPRKECASLTAVSDNPKEWSSTESFCTSSALSSLLTSCCNNVISSKSLSISGLFVLLVMREVVSDPVRLVLFVSPIIRALCQLIPVLAILTSFSKWRRKVEYNCLLSLLWTKISRSEARQTLRSKVLKAKHLRDSENSNPGKAPLDGINKHHVKKITISVKLNLSLEALYELEVSKPLTTSNLQKRHSRELIRHWLCKQSPNHSSGQVAVHLLTVCQLSRTLQRTQTMFIHNGVNALKEHEKLLFRSTHARLDEFIVD